VETIKHDPEEYGGVQDRHLTPEERATRYCAVKGCASSGHAQIGLPKYNIAGAEGEPVALYRLLCRKHVVEMTALIDCFYGDPSPLAEAKLMASHLGLEYSMLVDESEARPDGADGLGLFNPIWARCVRCGGAFTAETVGMYTGLRFVHTCGVTLKEHRDE
jgi:hypothetical protein